MRHSELVYIASPYGSDLKLEQYRYEATVRFTVERLKLRECAFSPIVHSHPLGLIIKRDADFWYRVDLSLLDASYKVIVLMLEGWEQSDGVQREIRYAEDNGLQLEFIEPSAFVLGEDPVHPIGARAKNIKRVASKYVIAAGLKKAKK